MDNIGQWLGKTSGLPAPEEPVPVQNTTAKALVFNKGPINDVTNTAHRYSIEGFDAQTNPEHADGESQTECVLLFQNGTVPEVGVNGITPEILIDVLIDRFEGFQSGQFACTENEKALEGLRQAKDAIQSRTNNRVQRKVEGTHQV